MHFVVECNFVGEFRMERSVCSALCASWSRMIIIIIICWGALLVPACVANANYPISKWSHFSSNKLQFALVRIRIGIPFVFPFLHPLFARKSELYPINPMASVPTPITCIGWMLDMRPPSRRHPPERLTANARNFSRQLMVKLLNILIRCCCCGCNCSKTSNSRQ